MVVRHSSQYYRARAASVKGFSENRRWVTRHREQPKFFKPKHALRREGQNVYEW